MIKQKRPAKKINKKIICFAYPEDLDQMYAFYCARYENIKWEEFKKIGLYEFKKKLGSIPKDEPLYDIIKSRTINIAKIKDKNERKYWRELKKQNKIPEIYLSTKEIYADLKEQIKGNKGLGGK